MSRRRRGGGITEGERRLWNEVARSVTPLPGRAAPPPDPDPPKSAPEPAPEPGPKPAAAPRRKAPAPPAWSDSPRPVGAPEPGLDSATARKLKRGLRMPDARIDLHGMTADRAHAALDRFVAEALARGHRCILVITGKGMRGGRADEAPWMHRRHGVLREEAPRWLRSGPNASRVVGVFEAHARHGGAGAFYVYLKRARGD